MDRKTTASDVAVRLIHRFMSRWVLPFCVALFVLCSGVYLYQSKMESQNRFIAIENALRNALRVGDQFLVRRLITSINTDSEYEDIKLQTKYSIVSWKGLNRPYSSVTSRSRGSDNFLISYSYAMDEASNSSLIFERKLPVRKIFVGLLLFLALAFFLFRLVKVAISSLVQELVRPIEIFANELASTKHADVNRLILKIDRGASYQELDQAIVQVQQLAIQVQALERSQAENLKALAVADLAKRVAHDIRSPLSAIAVGISRIESADPQLFRLISAANSRLQEIASNLLVTSRTHIEMPTHVQLDELTDKAFHTFCLRRTIESVVEEKKLEFSEYDVNFVIDAERYSGDFCLGSKIEFERMLSNLLNNSIQALTGHGLIKVTLFTSHSHHQLRIEDNGCGIPQDYLAKIGERNFSYGKKDGNGIGIFSAKQFIESLNGRFEISSLQNVGTRISIQLPA